MASPLLGKSGADDAGTGPRAKRPLSITIAWALLLLLGAFYLVAPVADLAADARTGLPADHLAAFSAVAGITWDSARQSAPGVTQYVRLLEVAYAVHELVFGILFLIVVAIPLRRGERWAWWACWAVMLANLTYSLTFGRHDPTILTRSLVADVGLPLLLLAQLPVVFRQRTRGPG